MTRRQARITQAVVKAAEKFFARTFDNSALNAYTGRVE